MIYKNNTLMQGEQVCGISGHILERMKPAKIIKDHTKDIVGMDFSDDGQILYVADSQTLNVYITATAQSYRRLFMKNHEIEQISHTHNNSAILVATKKNHLILYWSIHENRVIKMFKGHSDAITNLMINSKDDYFLTTSNDNTMRIWNLNSKNQGSFVSMKSVSSSLMFRLKIYLPIPWQALILPEWSLLWRGPNSKRKNRW